MRICTNCNIEYPESEFYNKQNRCKNCAKAYAKAWAKANPDKVKKSWKKANKKAWQKQKQDQEYILKRKLYRQATSATRTARAKAWNQANKEKFNFHVTTSKIKQKMSKEAKAYKILDKEIKRLYSSPCFFCGSTEKITMDHIIPISRSGNHSVGNLQPLCKSCNSSKKSRLVSEYKYYLSKLTA